MYSVSIVWSAFAFIHLRLVHPHPPLVLWLSLWCCWMSHLPQKHYDKALLHLILWPLFPNVLPFWSLHTKCNIQTLLIIRMLSLVEDRQVFILTDVLSWTHAQCKLRPWCRVQGMKLPSWCCFLRWQQGFLKASFTVYTVGSVILSVGCVTKAKLLHSCDEPSSEAIM